MWQHKASQEGAGPSGPDPFLVPTVRFTGHSVRSGLITEARRAGKDRKAISAVSGHVDGSPVLDGYIQVADRWSTQDNALKGVL